MQNPQLNAKILLFYLFQVSLDEKMMSEVDFYTNEKLFFNFNQNGTNHR